jgi:hypothetical protein
VAADLGEEDPDRELARIVEETNELSAIGYRLSASGHRPGAARQENDDEDAAPTDEETRKAAPRRRQGQQTHD